MQEDRTKLSPQSNKLFFYPQDFRGRLWDINGGGWWKWLRSRFLFAAQVEIGVLTRLGKQQDWYVHLLLINSQQGNNFCIVMSTINRKGVRKWVIVMGHFVLQLQNKKTSTYAAYAQTGGSLWADTSSLSPPIPLLLIFSKPRVLPLHPIVLVHWGMGHSDRFKQRA